MHKFTLADSITVEETSVMKAVASRRISQIEDGTAKGINEMLHSAREVRSEVAKKELDDAILSIKEDIQHEHKFNQPARDALASFKKDKRQFLIDYVNNEVQGR